MPYSYPKKQRLTKADEFSSVFNLRCIVRSTHIQIFIKPNNLGQARLGLVVAKSTARKAVHRNYMKRVIREYFRSHGQQVDKFDIIVRVIQPFYRAQFTQLSESLSVLWKKIATLPC